MKRQSGVTLLIVLVVVALSTIIAAQLIEQGTFSQRRTQLMLAREQAYQLALGGEALARQWMQKGFEKGADKVHLNQPWATTPMEFPIEGGVIRATVKDALSCFNLNSIVTQSNEDNQAPRPPSEESNNQNPNYVIYENLVREVLKEVENVEVSEKMLAQTLLDWIDADIEPSGFDGAEDMEYTGYDIPYRTGNGKLANRSELRVIKGYSDKIYKALKKYVCAYPLDDINMINVNTIDEEKLALLTAVASDKAQALISERPEDGYNNDGEIKNIIGGANNNNSPAPERGDGDGGDDNERRDRENDEERGRGDGNASRLTDQLTYKSDFFVVNIEVEYKGASFRMGSLMKRNSTEPEGAPFTVEARFFGDY